MPQNVLYLQKIHSETPVTQPGAKQYQRVVSEIDSWILPIASGPFGGVFLMDPEKCLIVESPRDPVCMS